MKTLRSDYDRSIRTGCAVWGTDDNDIAAEDRDDPGHMYAGLQEAILTSKRTSKVGSKTSNAPFDEARHMAASWNASDANDNLDSCMAAILSGDQLPNAEQSAFLHHFVARLKLEVLEQQTRTTGSSKHEPLLDVVHGFPGTGKSRVIQWMRELMEKGFGWEHGV